MNEPSLRIQFLVKAGDAADEATVQAASDYLSAEADKLEEYTAGKMALLENWMAQEELRRQQIQLMGGSDQARAMLLRSGSGNYRPDTTHLSNAATEQCLQEQIVATAGYRKLHDKCQLPEIDMKISINGGVVVHHAEEYALTAEENKLQPEPKTKLSPARSASLTKPSAPPVNPSN